MWYVDDVCVMWSAYANCSDLWESVSCHGLLMTIHTFHPSWFQEFYIRRVMFHMCEPCLILPRILAPPLADFRACFFRYLTRYLSFSHMFTSSRFACDMACLYVTWLILVWHDAFISWHDAFISDMTRLLPRALSNAISLSSSLPVFLVLQNPLLRTDPPLYGTRPLAASQKKKVRWHNCFVTPSPRAQLLLTAAKSPTASCMCAAGRDLSLWNRSWIWDTTHSYETRLAPWHMRHDSLRWDMTHLHDIWDITHSMRHDPMQTRLDSSIRDNMIYTYETAWLTHMRYDSLIWDMTQCNLDLTHSYETTWFTNMRQRDSHIWDMTHLYDIWITTHVYKTWLNSLETWLTHMRQHDSHIWDITHLYATWLTYMRHDSIHTRLDFLIWDRIMNVCSGSEVTSMTWLIHMSVWDMNQLWGGFG